MTGDNKRIVVDSIHGDVHLTEGEWRIIDTPSFQRLRYIKQLGMGHLTYPMATHTRFAHCIGALRMMQRILDGRVDCKRLKIKNADEELENLRLAALLHDIGHYPYSHLMEGVEHVQLMEQFVDDAQLDRQIRPKPERYPNHVEIGQLVVTQQDDLLRAIDGEARAERIADLFGRTGSAPAQLTKLINSSLDMDRADYLLRDSRAAGVPYGEVDINYLLNSVRISPAGMVGVEAKALPAAEQFLFARYYMHLTVYYHKTTCAFEECARQLLRRIRDDKDRAKEYELPADGNAVRELVKSREFWTFTDGFLDNLFLKAAEDRDDMISCLANAVLKRRPPKLLKEVTVFESPEGEQPPAGTTFKKNCSGQIKPLADKHGLPLWRFMLWGPKSLKLEQRGAQITANQATEMEAEEADELIKVFKAGEQEPTNIVDIEWSLLKKCAGNVLQLYRLYLVTEGLPNQVDLEEISKEIRDWDRLDKT